MMTKLTVSKIKGINTECIIKNKLFLDKERVEKFIKEDLKLAIKPYDIIKDTYIGFSKEGENYILIIEDYDDVENNIFIIQDQEIEEKDSYLVGVPALNTDQYLKDGLTLCKNKIVASRILMISYLYRLSEYYKQFDYEENSKKQYVVRITKTFENSILPYVSSNKNDWVNMISIYIYEQGDPVSIFDTIFNSKEIAEAYLKEIKNTLLEGSIYDKE